MQSRQPHIRQTKRALQSPHGTAAHTHTRGRVRRGGELQGSSGRQRDGGRRACSERRGGRGGIEAATSSEALAAAGGKREAKAEEGSVGRLGCGPYQYSSSLWKCLLGGWRKCSGLQRRTSAWAHRDRNPGGVDRLREVTGMLARGTGGGDDRLPLPRSDSLTTGRARRRVPHILVQRRTHRDFALFYFVSSSWLAHA